MLSLINSTTSGGSGAGGAVTIPFASGTVKAITKTKNIDFVIPAGAYAIEIFNNSIEFNITVNGIPLGPQLRTIYTYRVNQVAKIEDYVQQITVVNANAVDVIISVEFPSNNPINLNTI